MKVKVIGEYGDDQAFFGLSLSYYREGEDIGDWFSDEKLDKAIKQAKALSFKGGGHNKYLASIQVWLLVTAPRAWWVEFDTYKVGVTTNSASTMHTLTKQPVTKENFAEGTSQVVIDNLNDLIANKADITTIKMNLPEGYLQTRQVCLNYMSLQNIIKQRSGHRLKQWDMFINAVIEQVDYPELLIQQEK